jgi:hypothetical protein
MCLRRTQVCYAVSSDSTAARVLCLPSLGTWAVAFLGSEVVSHDATEPSVEPRWVTGSFLPWITSFRSCGRACHSETRSFAFLRITVPSLTGYRPMALGLLHLWLQRLHASMQ